MLRSFIGVVSLFLILPCIALAQTPAIAIVDVTVIPMDAERVLEHQTVLIRDGKISSIGPSLAVPPGVRKISGRGRFLTPGLIDAHVHLMSADDLISYLAYGVTTVVNMSGTPSDLALRRDVRSRQRLGPNIYTAGPTIDGYPPLNEIFVSAETPEQGAAIVAAHKRAGYDFIKVYGTLKPEVFRSIAAACRKEGMALTGHVNRQLPVAEVFSSGQVLAAHAEDLIFARYDHPPTDTELATLADETKKSGVTVTANIALNPATAAQVRDVDTVLAQDEAQYLSAATYSRWIRANNRNLDEDPKQHLENLQTTQAMDLRFVRLLRDRGVPIILGTDASAYGFPGQSVLEELRQTQAAGLSRYESLVTATRDAGRFLAKQVDPHSKIGTVAPGYVADLLLWTTNPLEADIKRGDLAGVVLRGSWVPAAEIEHRRELVKRRMANEHKLVNAIDHDLEHGDTQTAQRLLKRASTLSPLLDEWVLLTKARKQESRLPAAIAIARMDVQQFPNRFSSYQLLADLLQKSGNNPEARETAAIALRLQPSASTATNIANKATFSTVPASYQPGEYHLELASLQAANATLQLRHEQNGWTGSLAVENDSVPLRDIYFGADQLWFKAGEGFQEKEIRLTISRVGEVSGTWWSIFGRNGAVRGSKVH